MSRRIERYYLILILTEGFVVHYQQIIKVLFHIDEENLQMSFQLFVFVLI
jgi:hypothetical protein